MRFLTSEFQNRMDCIKLEKRFCDVVTHTKRKKKRCIHIACVIIFTIFIQSYHDCSCICVRSTGDFVVAVVGVVHVLASSSL